MIISELQSHRVPSTSTSYLQISAFLIPPLLTSCIAFAHHIYTYSYKHTVSRAQPMTTSTSTTSTRTEKFSADWVIAGTAAIAAKSSAAPIERVKLLLQNQGELLKRGRLKTPYIGVSDCFKRVYREEGVLAFWRGNQANVIRYFPTQVLSFLSLCLKIEKHWKFIFGFCWFFFSWI